MMEGRYASAAVAVYQSRAVLAMKVVIAIAL
jgi:hypothetical protein